jgi:hypothetical protein
MTIRRLNINEIVPFDYEFDGPIGGQMTDVGRNIGSANDGSIGSPSLHIRSFQLSQSSLSACWIIASPLAPISADRVARMLAIARALPTSLFKASGRRPNCISGPSGHPSAVKSDRQP